MYTLTGKVAAVLSLLLFTTSAYAGTKTGGPLGLAFFAGLFGLVAAAWPVTSRTPRIGIFLTTAFVAVCLSVILLMQTIEPRPFKESLIASIYLTIYITPIPFVGAFALARLLAWITRAKDGDAVSTPAIPDQPNQQAAPTDSRRD